MTTPLGDFGAPPDAVAWGALVLAALVATISYFPRVKDHVRTVPARILVPVLALSAAALSWMYVIVYLRGGPRIVDATSYFLEARALSEGRIAFPIPSPSGSFRGRFLIADALGRRLSVIFPPGYPAVLALGFVAGAPMLVGPAIAAALVVVTYAIGLRCFEDRRVALLAAALSAVCAVLRYHTADTMSHGWSALLLSITIWASLGTSRGSAVLAGASAGWLFATRPISGLSALVLAAVAARAEPRRVIGLVLAWTVPAALFCIEQRVATGSFLRSTQLAYYAVADGPPGCFRYGFGSSIGCLFEHGDFVRAHLSDGYGALAAAGTTLRRLKMHLADAGNAEVFALVLAYALVSAFRERRARLLSSGVIVLVLAYAPFYFDGNYPGGGARFYADALPLEHVLIAWALVRLSLANAALPVALSGFALHTVHDHRRLAEREGGRPMFEERTLHDAGVRRGLVFVDTDHGFDLAFDPRHESAVNGIVVARRRGDAHDRLLWERLGRPPAFLYRFDSSVAGARPEVLAIDPAATPATIEAEAEWPALIVSSGFVQPTFPACASGHRALAIHPAGTAHVVIGLPARRGRHLLRTSWVLPVGGRSDVTIAVGDRSRELALSGVRNACVSADGPEIDVTRDEEPMEITARSEAVLDAIELIPIRP